MMILGALVFASLFLISCGDSCKGHENDIKNGQIRQARKTGSKVTEIKVKYLGNCRYEVISEIFNPNADYGLGASSSADCIYEWKGNDYYFVSGKY